MTQRPAAPRAAPIKPSRAAKVAVKRTRLDKAARREQLLAFGLKAFASVPYDELSIDSLAREAGISKGLLYHYFPTKRDYYVATVQEAARVLRQETMTPDASPPIERLERGLYAYLSFPERHDKAYLALMRGGTSADPEVARVVNETREELPARGMNDAPRAPGELRLRLRGGIAFFEATAMEWLEHRKPARGPLVELWKQMFVAAVTVG